MTFLSKVKQWLSGPSRAEEPVTVGFAFGGNPSSIARRNHMSASIMPTIDGGFKLVDRYGLVVQTYTRARDARRGAARLGFTVA